MTKEPIIIDDVDVAECEQRCDTHKELLADGHIKEFIHYCQITNTGCYGYICHYKQLKCKEQECEELRDELEWVHGYKDKLNKEIDDLNKELLQKRITILKNNDHYYNVGKKNNELKQALQDIKEIAEKVLKKCNNCDKFSCFSCPDENKDELAKQILQKCEVIDD